MAATGWASSSPKRDHADQLGVCAPALDRYFLIPVTDVGMHGCARRIAAAAERTDRAGALGKGPPAPPTATCPGASTVVARPS